MASRLGGDDSVYLFEQQGMKVRVLTEQLNSLNFKLGQCIMELEKQASPMLREMLEAVQEKSQWIYEISQQISELDVVSSFLSWQQQLSLQSEVWCYPEMGESLAIEDGRVGSEEVSVELKDENMSLVYNQNVRR